MAFCQWCGRATGIPRNEADLWSFDLAAEGHERIEVRIRSSLFVYLRTCALPGFPVSLDTIRGEFHNVSCFRSILRFGL
jgi:hypothetical protein